MSVPNRFVPHAADFLLAADVSAANLGAAAVLDGCASFYDKDPKSVQLVGLYDIGYGNNAQDAMLQKDGKALNVPGEGVWQVADTGVITFQSDQALTGPPTPVAYRFADVAGSWSNAALIVMDPAINDIPTFLSGLEALDDDTKFWTTYRQHVSRAMPTMDPGPFVTITAILAGATKMILKNEIGANPVAAVDFDSNLQAWKKHHSPWDDAAGAAGSMGLFSICEKLVNNSTVDTSKTKFLNRYWRLDLMARMAAVAQA